MTLRFTALLTTTALAGYIAGRALMAAAGFYVGYDLGHTETDDWEG